MSDFNLDDELLADSAPQTTIEDVATIQGMATKAKQIQEYIAKCDRLRADADAALKKLLNNDIPDAMAKARTTRVDLEDGLVVEVLDIISASIPSDRKEEAFKWLRENGHGDIIKTALTVQFSRGEEEKCSDLAQELSQRSLAPVVQPSVHYQTLNALVRELNSKGENLPVETLGIWTGRQARIINPSASKGRARN